MTAQRKLLLFVGILSIAAGLSACGGPPPDEEAWFLRKGQALLEKKDYLRAGLEFQNAARIMPKDAEPPYRMGLAYLGAGNFDAAVRAFHKAANLNPKHAGAQLKLAALLTTSQNRRVVEDTKQRLLDVLEAMPGNDDATDMLAIAEFRLGEPQEAIKLIADALERSPANFKASVVLAAFRLSRGDSSGAEDVLRKAVAAAPRSPTAAVALGRLYLQLHKTDLAETELRRALQLDPHDLTALLSLAWLQAKGNRPDQAEQTYRQVAALSKDHAHLYPLFLLGQGKLEAALTGFERLAGENPNDRKARTRLLVALLAAKQLPRAEMILAETLKRNPKDTDALLQRSQLRLRSGDLRAAEADLTQVIGLNPDSAAAHFQLARVKLKRGLPRIERQELTVALQRDPKYLPARLALSRNLLAANEARPARELLDQTPKTQRNHLTVLTERNWALLGLGEWKSAREGIDRALRVTRTPELILQDGILKMEQRDLAGARKAAEELLERNPEDARAWRLLLDSDAARGQLGKALETLRAMASKHPTSAPIQFVLGRVLSCLGDRTGGRRAFETAIAADAKFSMARLALAAMDLSENRLDPARQGATAVVAAEPANVTALLLAAITEWQSGNTPAAIARYRAILDIDGSNVLAMNDLARLTARENPEQALKLAQQAVELAPDSAATQDTLAWLYYSKGFYGPAIQHLKAAVAREPVARYQYHLAMSYLKAGDEDLGEPLLALALKRDPELSRTQPGW